MSMEAALLGEIYTTLEKIRGLVQTLSNTINSTLSRLPFFLGWIADKVRDGWNWFMAKVNDFWGWLSDIYHKMGDGDALTRTADAWSDHVAAPVSKEVGNADAGMQLVDDNWQGAAAAQYKQIIPLQKTALDKIKTGFTDGISVALNQVRSAIATFKASLIVALVALAAGIIGAIAAADTIVGIPAAPVIGALAVAACAASLYHGITTLQSSAASANSLLRQRLDDSAGYPGGKWPSGVLN